MPYKNQMLCRDLLNKKEKGLLLVCCGPCCAGVVDYIAKEKLNITVFFYNPNIYPETEYNHRKEQVIKLSKLYNIPYIDTDYTPEIYFQKVRGFELCKEKGERCSICFELRLLCTAKYAKLNNFDYFTSTLAFSRWKDLNQVNNIGFKVGKLTGIKYYDINWRKCGIQELARQVVKTNNIYEQNYCGCIYSLKNKH